MKRIVLLILFIIASLFVLLKIEHVINIKTHHEFMRDYYSENSPLDIIFLGTSRMHWGISPMRIFEKYGITSYNRSTGAQHYKLSYIFEKESLKISKPKIIVIDIEYLLFNRGTRENDLLVALASMPKSIFTYNAYREFYRRTRTLKEMNTFYNYHARWENLNRLDFKLYSFPKGQHFQYDFMFGYKYSSYPIISPLDLGVEIKSIPQDVVEDINKMVSLAKIYNADVYFIYLPTLIQSNVGLTLGFAEIAKENGWNFIDYNNIDIGFNNFNDFADEGYHINSYGGDKIEAHLIPLLKEKYNLKDHRNEIKFEKWNKDYIDYLHYTQRLELKILYGIDEFLEKVISPLNYSIFISLKGSDISNIPSSYIAGLKSFGLKELDKLNSGDNYIALIDNNEVVFEKRDKDNVTYKGRMKKFVNLNILSSKDKASIIVSGKERSKNINGLNIVVYDKELREVVDSVGIDINAPYGVKRDPKENIIDKLRITPIYNEITLKEDELIFGGGVFKYNRFADKLAFSFDERFVSHNMRYNKLYDIGINQMIVERDTVTDEVKLYIGNRKDYGKYYTLKKGESLKVDIEEVKASKEEYKSNFKAIKIYTLNRNKLMNDISSKFGWSGNEGTHIWSVGRELFLPIYHTPKSENNKLVINLNAYLDSICPEQNIVISAAGKEFERAKFDNVKNQQLVEVEISKDLFNDSYIELKIDLLNEVSSPANNGSGDIRSLGIAMSDIYFD